MKDFKKLLCVFLAILCMGSFHFHVYASNTETDEQKIKRLESEVESLILRGRSGDTSIESLQDQIKALTQEKEETEKEVANPRIKLQSPTTVTIKGGKTQTINLVLKNVGSSTAESVLTQASVGSGSPFFAEFSEDTNFSYSLYSGGTKTIHLKVVVDKDAASGTYPITLTHSYKNKYDVNSTETDTLSIKVENDAAVASVVLYDFESSKPAIKPGDKFTLTATLENVSTQNVRDVQILIEGLKAGEINLSDSTTSIFLKNINATVPQTVTFNLEASGKIKKGTYPLVFKIKYKDVAGKDYESDYYYYANVSGNSDSEDKANLDIQNVSAPTGTMNVGENFTVKMKVVNKGPVEANNVKITAEPDTEGAIVPKSASVQQIRTLGVSQSQELTFSFAATAKAKSQNHSIGFTVEYETGLDNEDGTKEIAKFSQYAGVNVSNPKADKEEEKEEDEKRSIPKIIISRYAADPVIVKAGQEFDLSIAFQNTHSEKTIENVKAFFVTVEDTTEKKGSVFVPVDASNTFYIDKIEPKSETERHLKFYVIPDALPKNYIISVNFEYQDSEFNNYESVEQFGINVKQVTKLETYNLNVPTEMFVGQPASIYFDFYNTGKVTLSNLMVKLEGNFDTENAVSYYSNFTAGGNNYYEGTLTPKEAGPQKGKIIITYEDDTGEKIEEIKEFDMNVMEAMGGGMSGMDGGMMIDGGGMAIGPDGRPIGASPTGIMGYLKNPFVIGGSVVGVVVIGVAFFFIRKRVKSRRDGLDLDE